MDKMVVKGFVSNIYAWCFYVSVICLLTLILIIIPEPSLIVPFSIMYCFVVFTAMHFGRSAVRIVFKRFVIDHTGIRCGKVKLKYDEIKSISISKAFVEKWWGFRAVENSMGIDQHSEFFVEDMICVNCVFSGFKSKEANKAFYIPRNKRTDAALRAYCDEYNKYMKNFSCEDVDIPKSLKWRTKPRVIVRFCIENVILCSAIVLISTLTAKAFNILSVLKLALCLLLYLALSFSNFFEEDIGIILRKRTNDRIEK